MLRIRFPEANLDLLLLSHALNLPEAQHQHQQSNHFPLLERSDRSITRCRLEQGTVC